MIYLLSSDVFSNQIYHIQRKTKSLRKDKKLIYYKKKLINLKYFLILQFHKSVI